MEWFEKAVKAHPNYVRWARGTIHGIRVRHCPPLHLEDCIGIVVQSAAHRALIDCAPRGRNLAYRGVQWAHGVALDLILHVDKNLFYQAGILPPLALSRDTVYSCIERWWVSWASRYVSMIVPRSPREELLVKFIDECFKDFLTDTGDQLRSIQSGLGSHRCRFPIVRGEPETHPLSLLAELVIAFKSSDETGPYYVDDNGRLRFSATFIRDHQTQKQEVPLHQGEIPLDIASKTVDPASAASSDEAAAIVREALGGLQASLHPDQLDAQIVDSLLQEGPPKSVAGLARKLRRKERTVHSAVERVLGMLARHPRVKALRPGP